jgi:hypothetical protein
MSTLYRDDRIVRDPSGRSIPNAQIYWCLQPAVSTTNPPSPLASLFTDSTGVTPLSNPQVTDGFGHAAAYLANGIYTVVYVWNGQIQQVFPDQLVGFASPTSGGPILNVKDFGVGVGQAHGIRLGASISSGSAILTIASNGPWLFAASDVNSLVKVPGAGPGGMDINGAVITSFISTTQVTISIPASTTVTSTTACWYVTGQDVIDRTALNAANAAAGPLGAQITAGPGFFLYDITPTWNVNVSGFTGAGVRATLWIASNNNAGSFYSLTNPVKWQQIGGFSQGFSVYLPGYQPCATVTAYSITSNVGTFTVGNAITLPVGQQVLLQLFQADGTLAARGAVNNVFVTVLTSSSTQFTANITAPNISVATEIGIATPDVDGFKIGSGLWFGIMEEVEIYNPAGNGVQLLVPVLDSLHRVWVHNAGGFGFNIINTPGNNSGSTTGSYDNLYATGCYAPGFYGNNLHSTTIKNCAMESCGGCFVFDGCWSMSVLSPHCEQTIFRNANIPGKFIDVRSGRGIIFSSPWLILDSGGNAASTPVDFNQLGTSTLVCTSHQWLGGYINIANGTTAPTVLFNFAAGTTFIKVEEPYIINTGGLTFSNAGTNNSLVYQGNELLQGPVSGKYTGTSGRSIVLDSNNGVTVTTNPSNAVKLVTSVPAVVGGANQGSPQIQYVASFDNGTTPTQDLVVTQSVPGTGPNPVISLDDTHSSGSPTGFQRTINGWRYADGSGRIAPNRTITGNGDTAFNATGVNVLGTANNDLLTVFTINPLSVNVGVLTGVNVYGLYGHLSTATYTGTPAITAEVVAQGNVNVGTLNYGFYEPGGNPNFLGGGLIVAGNAPTVAANQIGIGKGTATTATAGTNGAVPAQVAGYWILNFGGVIGKVPFFNN